MCSLRKKRGVASERVSSSSYLPPGVLVGVADAQDGSPPFPQSLSDVLVLSGSTAQTQKCASSILDISQSGPLNNQEQRSNRATVIDAAGEGSLFTR